MTPPYRFSLDGLKVTGRISGPATLESYALLAIAERLERLVALYEPIARENAAPRLVIPGPTERVPGDDTRGPPPPVDLVVWQRLLGELTVHQFPSGARECPHGRPLTLCSDCVVRLEAVMAGKPDPGARG